MNWMYLSVSKFSLSIFLLFVHEYYLQENTFQNIFEWIWSSEMLTHNHSVWCVGWTWNNHEYFYILIKNWIVNELKDPLENITCHFERLVIFINGEPIVTDWDRCGNVTIVFKIIWFQAMVLGSVKPQHLITVDKPLLDRFWITHRSVCFISSHLLLMAEKCFTNLWSGCIVNSTNDIFWGHTSYSTVLFSHISFIYYLILRDLINWVP